MSSFSSSTSSDAAAPAAAHLHSHSNNTSSSIANAAVAINSSHGDGDTDKAAKPIPKAAGRPVVAYHRLFAYADPLDYLLMVVGGLAGITHGAALPVFFIFLGKLIDSLGALTLDPSRAPHEVNKVMLIILRQN